MRLNMLTRLSAWFYSLARKVKKHWWLWMTFFFVELVWDRIFSAINHYVDAHIHWLNPIVVFLTHSRIGVGIAVFFGTILFLIFMAFIETRPVATKPQLTILPDWRNGGLYDLQADLIGWELPISNTENRFHTIANNVRAKITYRHTLGNALISHPAVWLANGPPRRFVDRVSIGMGEVARLLVCVAANNAIGYYVASAPLPFELDANHRLEFGQWNVQIELKGDNVKYTYEGTLTLNPNAGADIAMEP
jgi:hypothetical protein